MFTFVLLGILLPSLGGKYTASLGVGVPRVLSDYYVINRSPAGDTGQTYGFVIIILFLCMQLSTTAFSYFFFYQTLFC